MARTQLTTITRIAETGTNPESVDVAAETTDGNSVTYTPDLLLFVKNGDDASLTVTIPTPGTVGRSGLAVGDITCTIPAGEYRLMGPFGREVVQATGLMHIDYAGTTPTNITVAPLRAY